MFIIGNTLEDDKMKDKISDEDRTDLMNIVDDTKKWLDSNQDCSKKNMIINKKNAKPLLIQLCKNYIHLEQKVRGCQAEE